ncbi:MAG: class I SAM-dependent methyltransferase [Ruminococcaceae bacterium]|nr:class I SAM-dependent methyltransferase [Oscillospiraceae bacterium]
MEQVYCQKTIDNYDRIADESEEIAEERYPSWEEFLLPYLERGNHILDLGCGTGHYSAVFQQLGFQISALDASLSLCRIASEKLGIPVRNLRFDQLTDLALYDAVWACCSLLHIPSFAMPDAFSRITAALKPGGYLYASFMEGEEEGYREQLGSYMTNMTEQNMRTLVSFLPELQIIEIKRTPCLYKEGGMWIHFLMNKALRTDTDERSQTEKNSNQNDSA